MRRTFELFRDLRRSFRIKTARVTSTTETRERASNRVSFKSPPTKCKRAQGEGEPLNRGAERMLPDPKKKVPGSTWFDGGALLGHAGHVFGSTSRARRPVDEARTGKSPKGDPGENPLDGCRLDRGRPDTSAPPSPDAPGGPTGSTRRRATRHVRASGRDLGGGVIAGVVDVYRSMLCSSIEYAVPSVASGGGVRAEKDEQTKQSAPLKQDARVNGSVQKGLLRNVYRGRAARAQHTELPPGRSGGAVARRPATPEAPSGLDRAGSEICCCLEGRKIATAGIVGGGGTQGGGDDDPMAPMASGVRFARCTGPPDCSGAASPMAPAAGTTPLATDGGGEPDAPPADAPEFGAPSEATLPFLLLRYSHRGRSYSPFESEIRDRLARAGGRQALLATGFVRLPVRQKTGGGGCA
ncbi:hypothetical protein HPB47_022789 [Ixodes persulcatus]|uniref:Uncharacterized protein n=1 Tax=Ixodes persulcatus TaxID=34615 RepID=A0AC60Q8Z8_IXOPE|nr:hypothetical protein HPB47_022789 [Ixodes persulcatus]